MAKELSSKEIVERILLEVSGAKGFRDLRTNEFHRVIFDADDDIFADENRQQNEMDQSNDTKQGDTK